MFPERLHFKNIPPRTIVLKNGGELETDPTGHFAYSLDGFRARLHQWRLGRNAALQKLSPHQVEAHSHPSFLRFHPSGRFAYVSCSHGALCQYRVQAGALVPLKPLAVYVTTDPSPLWFDATGRFACVLTYGEPDQSPPNDQVTLFTVEKNGQLTKRHKIDVCRADSPLSRSAWEGKIAHLTVVGSRLER